MSMDQCGFCLDKEDFIDYVVETIVEGWFCFICDVCADAFYPQYVAELDELEGLD